MMTRTTAAAAALALLAATLPAGAATFDGNWNITVVTEKGNCDQAYGYPIAIKGDRITYTGQTDVQVSGTLQKNGTVSVRVSRGDKAAQGTGRLSGSSGTGTWKAVSGGECSGRWRAERAG